MNFLSRVINKIRAYHGSGSEFDEFKFNQFMSTGEGAQAYGSGGYFAQREGTAKSYRDALSAPRYEFAGEPADLIYTSDIRQRFSNQFDALVDDEALAEFKLNFLDDYVEGLTENAKKDFDYDQASEALDVFISEQIQLGGVSGNSSFNLRSAFGDFDVADQVEQSLTRSGIFDDVEKLTTILANISQADSPSTLPYALSNLSPREVELYEEFVKPKLEFKKNPGFMYEVEIDATADELIDHDALAKDQPQVIRAMQEIYFDELQRITGDDIDLMGDIKKPEDVPLFDLNINDTTIGGDLYKNMAQMNAMGGPAGLSEKLKEKGIKGIQYSDAQTRFSKGDKTKNYVIFDDKIVEIMRRYGVPFTVAAQIALQSQDAQASPRSGRTPAEPGAVKEFGAGILSAGMDYIDSLRPTVPYDPYGALEGLPIYNDIQTRLQTEQALPREQQLSSIYSNDALRGVLEEEYIEDREKADQLRASGNFAGNAALLFMPLP